MDFSDGEGSKKRPRSDEGEEEDINSENEHQTSKSKGTVTVQIFIKKTYKMVNDCDPKIASWTPEGDKFMIKDPDRFANEVIPQYFDHNKFSSFTRQLNFYKFTREQSKVIKKSDQSSEVAKHQTFHHRYFQKGRPELLRHLQRSRKAHLHDDDATPSHGPKKPKTGTSISSGGGQLDNMSVLEQVSDLVRRATESEQVITNLQQENATLSFAIQKLQQQDDMKQRSLVALEEHVRLMELHMTQAFQQQQAQIQQFNQPLPFSRESSLSAVNGSSLMRYLSMNSGLNSGLNSSLQRLATPPFGTFSGGSLSQNPFGAAAAAENHVQQANENAAAAAAGSSSELGRMKPADDVIDAGDATLNRQPAVIGGADFDDVPTLPRHPFMKTDSGSASNAGARVGAASMTRQGFMGGPLASLNAGSALAGNPGAAKAGTLTGRGSGPVAPGPPPLGQNGFGGVGFGSTPQHNFANLAAANGLSAAAMASLRASVSVSPVPRQQSFPGNNGPTLQQQQLQQQNPAMLQQQLSNMANGVSREESFGIESLMHLARGPQGI